jgi:amino acid adenylation domain-containing protein
MQSSEYRIAPASQGQAALWFLHQVAPDDAAYNITFSATISAPVDVAALRRTFQMLAERHPALRTTYVSAAGRVHQRVHRALAPEFVHVDASSLDDAAIEDDLSRRAHRPFDLESGPILRVSLLSRGALDHHLLVVVHHLAVDATSIDVLMGELEEHYPHALAGTMPSVAAATPYTRFVRHEQTWLSSPAAAAALAHWSAYLPRSIPRLDLPRLARAGAPAPPAVAAARPADPAPEGEEYTFRWEAPDVRRLRQFARQEGVTLYAVLLAGFFATLERVTGEPDFAVGSLVTRRDRPELASAVGYLINTVVLRRRSSGSDTFRALVRQVQHDVLGALEHKDYPFGLLAERLNPAREGSRPPWFDVVFNWLAADALRRVNSLFLDPSLPAPTAPGAAALPLVPTQVRRRSARFDLELGIGGLGDDLVGVVQYRTARLDRETVATLVHRLRHLLLEAIERPEAPLSTLPLLDAAERHVLVEAWNDTARELPEGVRIHELFEAQAARTPDAVALAFEGQTLTYAGLDARGNQLARRLRALGVGPDVLVGVCLERSIELVVALHGILKAGGAYVPLDPTYPKDRLAFMLADTRVPVVLTQAHLAAALPPHDAVAIRLDADWADVAKEPAERLPPPGPRADDLAYVIYTSGSTGKPKGTLNTHRGILNRLCWMQRAYRLTAADRVLQKTPFSFDVSVWELFWPLLFGARLVLARPEGHRDPSYLAEVVAAQRITTIHFVPSMLRVFLDEPASADCASLRRVFCSGEALSPALADAFFARSGAELHNLYGPTETAVDVTSWACQPGAAVVPIGRPIDNTRVYVLDPHLEPVGVGMRGDLYLGGVQVGRGYLRRPELTAERFGADPFVGGRARMYRTGDVARWLPDGTVEFLGRSDFQVKLRGFRIELGEIEGALETHPAVRSCAVVTRDDARGDPCLVAYVALGGDGPSSSALRDHLKASLPEYMVPAVFVVLEALPLSPSGKIDRKALPEPPAPAGPARESRERTATERALAEVWGEVLGIDPEAIAPHHGFYDLGGHSLLFPRLAARMTARFTREIRVADLVRFPELAAAARWLEEGDETRDAGTEKARARGLQKRAALRAAQARRPSER